MEPERRIRRAPRWVLLAMTLCLIGNLAPVKASMAAASFQAATFTLTLSTSGGGNVRATPPGPAYAAGTVVTLTAEPGSTVLTGWTVDGVARGWANPQTVTMDGNHTVAATFVPRPPFSDVPPGSATADAVAQLAARGIIKGYSTDECTLRGLSAPCFGPDDPLLRAQVAALIVRAFGWGGDNPGGPLPFSDISGVDVELQRAIATLAARGIINGYGDTTFGPTDEVLHIQVVSFVTRAMVQAGYWQAVTQDTPALYPNVPLDSGHRLDLLTFVKYAGPIADRPAAQRWGDWDTPASRGWTALGLWQALDSFFGVRGPAPTPTPSPSASPTPSPTNSPSPTPGPVNRAPVAQDDAYGVGQNGVLTTAAPGVLTNDSDADGDTLTVALVAGPTHGALTFNPDGSFIYTPLANYSGSDTFTYRADDGEALSAVATVTLAVGPINQPPSFTKGADQTSSEDAGAQTITGWATSISAGPSAADTGQTVTFLVTNDATTLFSAQPAISADGTLTYTPAANANGSATVTVTLRDNGGTADGGVDTSASQTFVLTITPLNDAPVTQDDAYGVGQNGVLTTAAPGVLTNDSDADGDVLTTVLVSAQAHGSLTFNPDGSFIYTPNTNYVGQDSFTYRANDSVSSSDPATVIITIGPINQPPSFTKGGDQTVNEDAGSQTITGWATAISPGAPNETGQTLSFDVTANTNTALFSAQPAIDATTGTLTYTPAANANGTATLTVVLRDDGGTVDGGVDSSAPQTLTITVSAVNDAPIFIQGADQAVAEDSGTQTVANWLSGVASGPSNEAAQTLSLTVSNNNTALFSAQPAIDISTGTLTYTPAANANGSATVTLTLLDSGGTTNGGVDTTVQTFTITVTAVNDAPSFTKGADQAVADTAGAQTVTSWATNLSAGPPNESGQTLTFTATVSVADSARFTAQPAISSTGTLTYTPAPNAPAGTTNVTVTVGLQDNGGTANGGVDTAAPQTFVIAITHTNAPPQVVVSPKETFETIGNTALEFKAAQAQAPSIFVNGNLLANFTDTDGPDPLTMAGIVGCVDLTAPFDCATANSGQVSLQSDGTFTFTPKPGDTAATDTFQYQVTDGSTPVTRTVTITLKGRIWYVANTAGVGGDGTSALPFNTLAAAQTASLAGDYIFVYGGDGTTTGQNAGITLKANQKLYGQAHGLIVDVGTLNGVAAPTTLVAADSTKRPQIGNSAGDGVAVANVAGVEIRGLSLAGSTNAIDVTTSGTTGGTVAITNNLITGAGAEGIDINAAGSSPLTVTVSSNTIVATGNGFDARTAAGSGALIIAFNSNTGITSGATGIVVDGSAAGTTTITGFSGNVVSGNTVGTGIAITGATFDTTAGGAFDTVSGGATTVGASGNRVGGAGMVLTNVKGDLSFTDLDIFADNGAGLRVTSSGAFNAGAGTGMRIAVGAGVATVEAINGPAVDIATTTVNLPLATLQSTTSTTTGVALDTVAGTFSAGSGSEITNATGIDFTVNGSAATITYAGTITDTVGNVAGVSLTNNTGGTIAFTGALTLSTGSAPAFSATGGGTVTATGATNTLTTTTATALNVTNTTIGGAGLIFRSISAGTVAAGPTSGIVLNNTGSSGGLTVVGNGGTCTTVPGSCTGGTIQKATGDGLSLTSTQNVSLSAMNITNNNGNGLYGNGVTNLTLANSSVTNNDADNSGAGEAGLRFDGLYGTSAITNTTVSGTLGDNIRLTPSSGTLNNLTISGSTIGPNPVGTGANGVAVVTSGSAQVTVTVTTSTFTGNQASGFLTTIGDGTTAAISIATSTFQDNNTQIDLGSSGSGTQKITVTGNTLLRALSNAVNIVGDGAIDGTINGNQIGNGTIDSGSRDAYAIGVSHRSNLAWKLAITNNTVRNSDFEGIFVRSGDISGTTGSLDLTITGNTISAPDDNSGFPANPRGLYVRSRQGTTVCANIANNDSQGNAAGGYHLQRSDTSQLKLQGFTTDGATTITGNTNRTAGGTPTTSTFGEPFQGACTAQLPTASVGAVMAGARVPAVRFTAILPAMIDDRRRAG